MKKSIVCISALLLAMSSCTHRLTDFTVISTRNVPIGSEPVDLAKSDKRVQGVDKISVILGIPIGSPNMKEAIDKALDKYPGAVGLSDGVIKAKYWTCLFYGESSYVVEGTPLYEYNENGVATEPRSGQTPSNNRHQVNLGQPTTNSVLFFHEVKRGESLASIAQTYGVSVTNIIKWNGLSSSTVEPGTKIKIILNQ